MQVWGREQVDVVFLLTPVQHFRPACPCSPLLSLPAVGMLKAHRPTRSSPLLAPPHSPSPLFAHPLPLAPPKVRVGLQVVGMLGPAACLLLAVSPLVAGSASAASFLITCGLGLSALTLGGVSSNHLDIAPRHAGEGCGMKVLVNGPRGGCAYQH